MDYAGTASRKRQGTLVFEKTGKFIGLDFKMKSGVTALAQAGLPAKASA
jgi:hypothetical protein